jgi:hypothetical protein
MKNDSYQLRNIICDPPEPAGNMVLYKHHLMVGGAALSQLVGQYYGFCDNFELSTILY